MAIRSKLVRQIVSYAPVADELGKWLSIIQDNWKCKVTSVYETEVNKIPGTKGSKGFIIIYDDQEDVQEVIHAKWEINSDGYYPYCSHCKNEPENGKMTKWCPECGAKMDKE